jgi:hypothetical protein
MVCFLFSELSINAPLTDPSMTQRSVAVEKDREEERVRERERARLCYTVGPTSYVVRYLSLSPPLLLSCVSPFSIDDSLQN